jgi:hypothetical protein
MKVNELKCGGKEIVYDVVVDKNDMISIQLYTVTDKKGKIFFEKYGEPRSLFFFSLVQGMIDDLRKEGYKSRAEYIKDNKVKIKNGFAGLAYNVEGNVTDFKVQVYEVFYAKNGFRLKKTNNFNCGCFSSLLDIKVSLLEENGYEPVDIYRR